MNLYLLVYLFDKHQSVSLKKKKKEGCLQLSPSPPHVTQNKRKSSVQPKQAAYELGGTCLGPLHENRRLRRAGEGETHLFNKARGQAAVPSIT